MSDNRLEADWLRFQHENACEDCPEPKDCVCFMKHSDERRRFWKYIQTRERLCNEKTGFENRLSELRTNLFYRPRRWGTCPSVTDICECLLDIKSPSHARLMRSWEKGSSDLVEQWNDILKQCRQSHDEALHIKPPGLRTQDKPGTLCPDEFWEYYSDSAEYAPSSPVYDP